MLMSEPVRLILIGAMAILFVSDTQHAILSPGDHELLELPVYISVHERTGEDGSER